MKGHIRKRGDKSWAVVLDLGRDETGKRRQKWHTVRGTKKDAERELAHGGVRTEGLGDSGEADGGQRQGLGRGLAGRGDSGARARGPGASLPWDAHSTP